MSKILIVPGYDNSGPDHWQTWMEKKFLNCIRVQQRDWLDANREEWVSRLNDAVEQHGDDVVLVGHSCGTMTIVFWGVQFRRRIKGALLVAATDTEMETGLPPGISGFKPIPRSKLPFPSIVVASSKDPYMDTARGRQFAADWGTEYVNIGDAGHINTAAGYGEWPRGEALLLKLLE